MKKLFFAFLLLVLSLHSIANIRLPKILGDNMVLQRNKNITLWGWADANEKVSVQFNKQSKSTKADKSGKWTIVLAPEVAGGPFQLVIKGKNTITLSNILVGEVWVCSGQSNMEWPVRNSNNAEEEIKNATFPSIRHFEVTKSVSLNPEEDVKGGSWNICSPETVGNFTAVGYFFARELYQKLNIPIGLIHTSWGGTHSETWTSHEAFAQSVEFKDMIATMPKVDLDGLTKQKQEALVKKINAMGITFPAKDVEKWKRDDYDAASWKTMSLPNLWEQKGFENFDGVVWFRKIITVTTADAGKEATLELGRIDDSDESFVNGVLVGATKNRYDEKRKYKIPAGVLKEGKNTIAVRVDDTGGGGGLYGEAADMKLTTASGAVTTLVGDWSFNIESVLSGSSSVGPNEYPTLLFNAMLNPITNYSIQGAIWYQGESNAGRAFQYRTAFPLMIQDWRNHFKQGNFPFYFVQLANFNASNGTTEHGSTWAELREAQTSTLSLPNTGMAVTTDIGNPKDIHPRNKQDVGKRMAAIALNKVYQQNNVYSGPVYKSMEVEGNTIRLTFTEIGGGLMAKDKYGYVKGFEIAGSDQKFKYAKAWVDGNDILVSAEGISSPAAVRYAWADNPEDANLYNKEGFPASPFRTDTWKGITEGAKFGIH
jgi:sialate O-acetylesterase